VAADAYLLKPFTVKTEGLDVNSGQTVDIILTANQKVGNYWIRLAPYGYSGYTTPFGAAVLHYHGASSGLPTTPLPSYTEDTYDPTLHLAQEKRYKGLLVGSPWNGDTPEVPKLNPPPKPLVLGIGLQYVPGSSTVVANSVNNASLVLPATPYALGIAKGFKDIYGPPPSEIPFTPWDYTQPPPTPCTLASNYYRFAYGKYVDIVLQNEIDVFNSTENHPWHMHGHHFWVLAQELGIFYARKDTSKFNLVDPPFRFTTLQLPGGWTAIRFKADNAGAWLFHCHIEYHNIQGMAIVFVDGYVTSVPANTPLCGALNHE
jgi:L-ascorbate oxidase